MMDVRAEIERLKAVTQKRLRTRVVEGRDDLIIQLYDSNKCSLTEVSKDVGCCIETVRNVLRRNGIKLQPVGHNYRYKAI